MTSPRITRLSEGQWLSETPATTPTKPFPKAREMSMTSKICGMPITRSMHQEMTASTLGPRVAAATPSSSAITALTTAVSAPMRILSDRPASVRASISRPIQSVPKIKSAHGIQFFRAKSVSSARSPRSIPLTSTAHSRAAVTASKIRARRRLFQCLMCLSPPLSEFWDRQRRTAGRLPSCPQIRWPL